MTSLSPENDISEAVKVAASLVAAADQNIELLKKLPGHVLGVQALTHKIRTERNVLIKGCKRPRWLKLEHVISSNLHHLGAVVQFATALSDKVDAVLKKYRDFSSNVPVFVDVVANGGLLWMKVVCRCPNTLQLAHCTGGRAGERSPLHQARALLSLASQHPVLYSAPKVAFIFCKGVSQTVSEALRKEGIIVCTPFVLPDSALPASRYLPQDEDDDDDTLSLASDCSVDSNFEAALVDTLNTDMLSYCMDSAERGGSNTAGTRKSMHGNFDLDDGDAMVNVCASTDLGDRSLPEVDYSDANQCNNFNNEYLQGVQSSEISSFLDAFSNNNKNSTNKIEENFIHDPNIGELQVENINSKNELNANKDSCSIYEKEIVLKSTDESVLEMYSNSSKKQWPLCSNDDILKIAQALRAYTDKGEWAQKAKKSQTFVSLCHNFHYIGNQFGSYDRINHASNYQENEISLNNVTQDSAPLMPDAGLPKSQGDYLENCSRSQSLLRDSTFCDSLNSSSGSHSNCDLNQCRNINTNSSSGHLRLNASLSKNSDLPLKSTENLITSDKNKPNKSPRDTNVSNILETAAVDVHKACQLRGALRPAEETQAADVAVRRVCLDVPTMIAYIANTSNGFSHCQFKDGFLRQQALWEQEEPIKPVIEKYWQDCEVFVCKEALKRFESIVGVMAGEQEMRRAKELVCCVTIVPDHDELKSVLQACGGITRSSRIIFGTALHYKAPLITANRRFVRSAHTQGVSVAALLHNPRALTEQKQLLAAGCDTPLGGADVPVDSASDCISAAAAAAPSSSFLDPLAVREKSRKKAGVERKPAGDSRKQVLSCLSSARYLSSVTPVPLLSSE